MKLKFNCQIPSENKDENIILTQLPIHIYGWMLPISSKQIPYSLKKKNTVKTCFRYTTPQIHLISKQWHKRKKWTIKKLTLNTDVTIKNMY